MFKTLFKNHWFKLDGLPQPKAPGLLVWSDASTTGGAESGVWGKTVIPWYTSTADESVVGKLGNAGV